METIDVLAAVIQDLRIEVERLRERLCKEDALPADVAAPAHLMRQAGGTCHQFPPYEHKAEVLQALREGKSHADIMRAFPVSERTLYRYRRELERAGLLGLSNAIRVTSLEKDNAILRQNLVRSAEERAENCSMQGALADSGRTTGAKAPQ